jgi:hypothetical protein
MFWVLVRGVGEGLKRSYRLPTWWGQAAHFQEPLPGVRLTCAALKLVAMPSTFLQTLKARFDTQALRAPQLADAGGTAQAAPNLQAAVQAWCVQSLPAAGLQLAALVGPSSRAKSAWVADLALRLDGSYALQSAGGAARRLVLRSRVKAQDLAWWRPRQATDFWDCGYIAERSDAVQQLERFKPRRATLMLADAAPEDLLLASLQALWARRAEFDHAVRVLVLSDAPPHAPLALSPEAPVWHWPV